MAKPSIEGHIVINDDGRRVFAWCGRCENYIVVWANDGDRADAVNEFIERHGQCPGLPVFDVDEIKHVPPLASEERCPRMGLQGAIIK